MRRGGKGRLMEEAIRRKKRNKTGWKEWIKDILIAVVIAIIIVQFIKPTIVKESSMEPNFYENDYLFVYKMAYKFGNSPKKGDVVVFKSDLQTDSGDKKLLIKRVIGVPGDKVTVKNGEVYVNDSKDSQAYTKDRTTKGFVNNVSVPKGKLFCMGDNREVSIDSRYEEVGLVKRDDVVGKVVFRLYPFGRFGTIHNPYK